jgi:hypothetical protein
MSVLAFFWDVGVGREQGLAGFTWEPEILIAKLPVTGS